MLKEKPRDLQTYMHLMYERGIEVKPYINKQGNIRGYRFVHLFSGTDLKASEVDQNLKLNELFLLPKSDSMVLSGSSTQSSSQDALSPFSDCQANIPLINVLANPLSVGGGGRNEENRRKKRKR